MNRFRASNGDRGVTMPLFAFAIVALAAVAALVLGASDGYSAVRNSQNAADAAATAATAALHEVISEGASPSTVAATAVDVAEDNGADPGSVVCEIVTADYAVANAAGAVLGPCNGTNEQHALAAGVRVTLEETRSVPFGAFVGDDDITANSTAAATLQPVREGSAPFMVCANATAHSVPLLHSLNSPWAINEAAIGTSVVIWGNEMKVGGRDCGNGSSSWRGWVAFEGSWPVPSPDYYSDANWWEVKTGNSSGHIPRRLAGDDVCGNGGNEDPGDLNDCRIILPLCTHGNGGTGSGFKLHCVRLGAFLINYNSKGGGDSGPAPCMPADPNPPNNLMCAQFLGSAVASEGESVVATPLPEEVVAIRLVQ